MENTITITVTFKKDCPPVNIKHAIEAVFYFVSMHPKHEIKSCQWILPGEELLCESVNELKSILSLGATGFKITYKHVSL